MSGLVITAYTLRYVIDCERRVWLNQHGDASLRDQPSLEFAVQGIGHERAVQASMFGQTVPVEAQTWAKMVSATQTLMKRGVTGIQGAAFERALDAESGITVRGRVDWLRRVAQPSQLGGWSYEPVEIKLRRERSDADAVQLDLYIWLLEAAQGVQPSGWLWLGRDEENHPQNRIEHIYRETRLQGALSQAVAALTQSEAPPVFLGSHCKLCPWRASCEKTAKHERSVALLPGLPRHTWEGMRRAGIHTIDQLLELEPDDLRHFKGVGKKRALELLTSARAYTGNRPTVRGPMPEAARLPGVMLDLETRLDDGSIWCFGWQGADGRIQAAIVDRYYEDDSLLLPDGARVTMVESSDEGWRMVAAAAQEMPGPVYHWGSFEMGMLKNTAPPDVIDALADRLHDLNRTFRKTVAIPVRGTSLKTVAPYLGFEWPEGTNALTACADYEAWLLDNNAHALARACAYNRADIEAMAMIWRWLLDITSESS
jgi:uncharacterized protein